MAGDIRRFAKVGLGEDKGNGQKSKETWCWNKEV